MAKYFNKLVDWLSTKTTEKLIAMSMLSLCKDLRQPEHQKHIDGT